MTPGIRSGVTKTGAMKKTFYFQHDYNARSDPKLQAVLRDCGVEGIGVYWCIVEMLYEQGGTLPIGSIKDVAFALHVSEELVEGVVRKYKLFKTTKKIFWSESVKKRIDKATEISTKRKESITKRWKSKICGDTNVLQMNNTCNTKEQETDTKVIQTEYNCTVNKIKENKSKEESLSNDKEGESKKRTAFLPPSLEEVQAYIKEKGYSIDAEAFIAFYSSKNWYVGKNKMTNWRMAVVTWSKRPNDRVSRTTSSATTRNCNDEWK